MIDREFNKKVRWIKKPKESEQNKADRESRRGDTGPTTYGQFVLHKIWRADNIIKLSQNTVGRQPTVAETSQ